MLFAKVGLFVNSDSSQIANRNELTNLQFLFGYSHHYRYFRSRILENDIDTTENILSDLKAGQIENIVAMLRVELVVNAVMYCEDLAIMLLALRKPVKEIIKTVASLHETGAGSVKEFYAKLPQHSLEYFWELIKYDKFCEAGAADKYQRSCKRFRADLLKLSKFFLTWYNLFAAYKHGLNVVSLIDSKTGKDLLMIGKYDGTFDIIVVHPSWPLGYIEVTEIVYRMFNNVVDPIIWKIMEDISGVNLKETQQLTKTLTSGETEDKARPIKFTINAVFPWKIFEAKEYRPFY